MNEREERLKKLICDVQQYPKGSSTWRIAMARLLREIQQLPGLIKSSHPDYGEVLNDAMMCVAEKIEEFEPKDPSLSLEKSLLNWIHYKLRFKYDLLDLHSNGCKSQRKSASTAKTEFKQQIRKPPLSLDTPVGESSNETFGDRLSASDLWELQEQIAKDRQQQNNDRVGIKLQEYIKQDPQGKLKSCYPKEHPDCNCYILSQRLHLKVPPDKLVDIAKEFRINYHTLNWHWKNKGLPLLRKIALKLGYQKDSDE